MNAPKVTPAQIQELMLEVAYVTDVPVGTTSTFVHAYVIRGDKKFYIATGHSACVSPENFNAQMGYDIAMRKATAEAEAKLWELEGYALFKELTK